MTTKRNVKGIILQPGYPNCLFDGDLDFKDEHAFHGRLSDRWGLSEVKGVMSENELHFRKKYDHRNSLTLYSFRKEGDLWIGSYIGETTGIGGAQCEIYDGTPKIDWDKKVLSERIDRKLVHECAQWLIQSMINREFLRSSQDPTTGESMVELTEKGRDFANPERN